MHSQCRCSDIIVGASICDNDHNFAFVGLGLGEEFLGGESDGSSRAGAAAPVVDAFDGVEQLGLGVVLAEGELQPLLVGVLHGAHSRVCVGDLELSRDVGHKLEHRAEVASAHAAGAVDDKGDVVGVEAGFAANQSVCVAYSLHQRLRSFPQSEPARHGQGKEAVCATHGLRDRKTTRSLGSLDTTF